MKKLLLTAILTLAILLTACKKQQTAATPQEFSPEHPVEVKIGVVGSNTEVWDFVSKKFAKDGIQVKLVNFTDYNQPNEALLSGDIDLNSFQHQSFLDKFNASKGSDIVSIGNTVLAPLGLHSNKIQDLSQLKEADKVAIPDDVSNGSRALILLQTAGLIKVDGKPGDELTLDNITENKLNLQIIPMDASQTARAIDYVTLSAINNGMATDAGYVPTEDAIFLEPVDENSKPYINIIAARAKDKDNKIYQHIVKTYQQKDTKEVISETTKGSSISAWEIEQ